MDIKNNVDYLQSEAKHLSKLKILNENMVNKYENNIFPSTIEKYYQNKLSLVFIQSIDNIFKKDKNKIDIYLNNKIEIGKELLSVEQSKTLLGTYYHIISDFFINLRKNQNVILYILKNIKGESQTILINYISLLFYENAFEVENNNLSEVLNSNELVLNKILENLIESELDAIIKNGHNYSKFLDNTLAAKIIKNLLKKEDVQRYLRNIFYEIIIDIIEMENKNVFMEPNRIRDYFIQRSKTQENLALKDKNKDEKDKNFLNKIKNMPRNSLFPTSDNIINDINKNNLPRNSVMIEPKFGHFLSNTNLDITKSLDITNIKNNKTCSTQNLSTLAYTSKNIANLLYEGLTHSRLIYSSKEQKKFFNENEDENNCYDYYKSINIDDFLDIKEKNPEINNDYSKYELSQKELNTQYLQSSKTNKYMEEFYFYQIKELQKDPNKTYSNLNFIKFLKKNFSLYLDGMIPQYKKNFEKIKYFIDKMIYKMLQNKEDKIPFCIKNIVNIIRNYIKQKEKSISQIEINRYICEFYIGKIIIPFLTNEEYINLIIGKKIDNESKTFLFYFAKIIKKIFRSNFYDSFEQHFTIFNIYLCEILPYINMAILNFIVGQNNDSKNEIKANKNEYDKNSDIQYINNIIKYDSGVINEKILIIILEYLINNNNDDNDLDLQKLLLSDNQLNENLKLISNNFNEIIQQFSQGNEMLNKNIINLDSNLNINDSNIGGQFFILVKEEITKQKNEIISLSTKCNLDIVPKIKYALIKLLELMPYNLISKNHQLHKNNNIIQIFSEMKKIAAKLYISDFINENNKIEKEKQISFIWYLDYFLNSYNNLTEDYKNNDFNKLFTEIENNIKNEILLYKNDLSEYTFSIIIDKINEKINSMNNLFNYYNQNVFLYKINNYISNLKIKLEIYEYINNDKILLYLNKLTNKDNKEIIYVNSNTIENVSQFIKYLSNHILNENILNNFIEIEKNSKSNFSQINNINTLLDDYIKIISNNVIEDMKKQIIQRENNNIEIDIEEKYKDKIDKIMDISEELIHEGIYRKIWPKNKTNEDNELYNICTNKLVNVVPKKIGINEKYINEYIWQNIIYLINTKYDFNNYKTPMKKIKCFENIYNIIDKSINVITNKKSQYSVDDIFPIFVYLLIQTKPENLVTNLNFIKLLINKKNLIKSSGFALTQLEMAVQYLQNIEIS